MRLLRFLFLSCYFIWGSVVAVVKAYFQAGQAVTCIHWHISIGVLSCGVALKLASVWFNFKFKIVESIWLAVHKGNLSLVIPSS